MEFLSRCSLQENEARGHFCRRCEYLNRGGIRVSPMRMLMTIRVVINALLHLCAVWVLHGVLWRCVLACIT